MFWRANSRRQRKNVPHALLGESDPIEVLPLFDTRRGDTTQSCGIQTRQPKSHRAANAKAFFAKIEGASRTHCALCRAPAPIEKLPRNHSKKPRAFFRSRIFLEDSAPKVRKAPGVQTPSRHPAAKAGRSPFPQAVSPFFQARMLHRIARPAASAAPLYLRPTSENA